MPRSAPVRGQIIWIDFDPTLGHEQQGHRPALVISHTAYNQKSGTAIVCAITRSNKPWPFLVPTGNGDSVAADQVRTIDWEVRKWAPKDHVAPQVLTRVLDVIDRLTK
jgi:mRNA interferase MazF